MKAIRTHKAGGPEVLTYEEDVPIPELKDGHVLVRNKACGINYIDVYHRNGVYPVNYPFTVGRDGSGVIEKVGAGVESSLKVGDRVAYIFPVNGSYAEFSLVNANNVVKIPDTLNFGQGAAAMIQGLTAHYLVRSSYPIRKGDSVLVHAAAGGLGRLVVQLARHLGAFVIGTCSTEEKAKIARAAGCHEVILYSQLNFETEVKRITNGKGVHAVYDSVGKDTFDKSLGCLSRRGYLVLCGYASGKPDPLDVNLLQLKGSLFLHRPTLGDFIGTREELLERADELMGWIANGALKLEVLEPIPMKDAVEAHRMLEGRATTGKLVLVP